MPSLAVVVKIWLLAREDPQPENNSSNQISYHLEDINSSDLHDLLTLSNFSGISSSSVGCSKSGSVCCRDLLCCSLFSWAWAACCRSSSAFLRCFLCLFLNFFNSDGARFSVKWKRKQVINMHDYDGNNITDKLSCYDWTKYKSSDKLDKQPSLHDTSTMSNTILVIGNSFGENFINS